MRRCHGRGYLWLALPLLAASCGGHAVMLQQPAPDAGTIAALLDLPAPSSFLRQGSLDDGPLFKTGDAYDGAMPAHMVSPDMGLAKFYPMYTHGDSLVKTAYCGYRFDLTGYSDPVQLAYSFSVPPASSGLVYLGVGNFVKDAWDWHAAPLNSVVTLADDTPYRSAPSNEMLVEIVCLGTEHIDLVNIRIGNVPPVAIFTANTLLGLPGDSFTFDATGSSDVDGLIAKYQWDPEGDGTYLPLFLNPNGTPTKTLTYSQPGTFHPTVRVTDDSGACATFSRTLTITLCNKYEGVLDNAWGAGEQCSLALVNNCPAVAYMVGSALHYIYALAPDALNWGDAVEIDASCGGMPSLAAVAGRPAIAYQSGGLDLAYVRANNASGSSWPVPKIAVYKYDAYIGYFPALVDVGGLPGIAYSDSEMGWGGTTWYVRGDDAGGTSWQAEKHVSPGGVETVSPSLAVVSGVPMLTYVAANGITPYQIDCSLAADSLGDAWHPAVIAVQSGEPDARQRSLVIAGGKPAVGYFDDADNALKFARASQVSGQTWTAPVAITTSPGTSGAHCFAVINGLPCCAYGTSGGELCYVIAKTSTGSSWNPPITVDAAAHPYSVSLIEIYRLPAIAYFDGVARELCFVIYE